MKKRKLVLALLPLLVLALASVSQAWQGRMGGMGNPYGLVQDESDFLINPAGIANGEGIMFYGHYQFTYTDVMDWDSDYGGVVLNISGQEYKHDTLLGATFPLGPGRMGFLFEYAGKRDDYENISSTYELTSNLDNFALRLLYGLPLGGFNLGGEVQFAYRQEENKTRLGNVYINYFGLANFLSWPNIFRYMVPYDSEYWETLFKGSVDGEVGPVKAGITTRGGFIFSGDNEFYYEMVTVENFNLNGDVKGWRIGGDLWARYILSEDLSLPFLVRIDYQEKARDGDGQGGGALAGINYDYKHKETPFKLEVGGGVDTALASSTRIAAGLYYHYLKGEDEIQVTRSDVVLPYDYNSPASTEHRVVVKLTGEHGVSPALALRLGINFFYGWVQADYDYFYGVFDLDEHNAMDGNRWGVGASVGGTVSFNSFTLEPFIAGGYQSLDLSGGHIQIFSGSVLLFYKLDDTRNEWSIGGGVSVLFDVP